MAFVPDVVPAATPVSGSLRVDAGIAASAAVNTVEKYALPDTEKLASHYRGEKLVKAARPAQLNPRLVCLADPGSALAERYYNLRHAVESMRAPAQGLVVALTSPGKGEGKSLTALNLAGALAQDRTASVLLVDLNIRQQGSTLTAWLGLPQAATGISDWLNEPARGPEPPVCFIADYNFYLLLPGGKTASPYELLNSTALSDLLMHLRLRYDFVIIDAAQVLQVPDIQLLSKNVDGFLVVIRADTTSDKMLEETLNQIQPDKMLGLIFNGASN